MYQIPWNELGASLLPGIVLTAIFVGLFIIFVLGHYKKEKPGELRRDGSVLVPRVFIAFWYWLITPMIRRLARWGVTPNHITLLSLILALFAGLALALAEPMAGAWLLIAAATCDLLDGLLARETNSGSAEGAFFDSFADRLAEGLVFGGLAFWGGGGLMTWLAMWALIASLLVSYARARGEALGADVSVGLMQRPERTLMLIFILVGTPIVELFSPPATSGAVHHLAIVGVGLLALLSSLTAIKRAYYTMRALRERAARPGAPAADPDAVLERDPTVAQTG